MKKNIVLAVIFGPVVVGLAILAGCNRQSGQTGNGLVSAEKNSFNEVTSRLDAGGDVYVYLSTERVLEGISEKLANWRQLFASMPGSDPSQQQQIGKAFDLATALVKDSGIEDISGFGMSAIATEPAYYRTKAFVHHYSGRGSGFLWKMLGGSPHALDGLDLAPSNTALVAFSDLDLNIVWTEVKKLVDASDLPQAQAVLAELPSKFEQAAGISWDKAIGSLGGEFGVILTLDDANVVQIPVPGRDKLEIPEPGLMIVAKVKNDALFDRIDEQLKKMGPQLISVDKGGLRMRTFPVPLPLPIQLRPSVATSEGYLFIATSDYLIQDALAVKGGHSPGLRSTAEFKKLSTGVGEQGNHFTYVSQLFGQTITKIQRQAMENSPKMPAAQKQWLESFLQPGSARFGYCVGANTENGWYVVGNGNQRPAATVLAAAAVPAALVAAVALPAMSKARSRAQEGSCINNLRRIQAAKQRWAQEKGMPGTAMPSLADLKPYLGRGALPQCPEGGDYTIGEVDEAPTCSIAGHRLKAQ